MVRYVYLAGGEKKRAYYQNILDRIREKYEIMLKKSNKMKNKVEKWISIYQKSNMDL